MLSCKDVTRKISQAQDRKLTLREWIAVKLHLLICYACRRFVRQLAIVTAVSRRVLSEENPPDDAALTEKARQRIRERLQDSADEHGKSE